MGIYHPLMLIFFPGGSVVKNLPAGDIKEGLIPVLGRSPREGNGNLLQYSCLVNPMDRGAWQATVHGVPKSQTWLSTHTHSTCLFSYILDTHRSTHIRSWSNSMKLSPSSSTDDKLLPAWPSPSCKKEREHWWAFPRRIETAEGEKEASIS